ncbi:MAG: leucine-rich repeat-containing protein kinase family protein [Cyanobacteria bacterium J06632_22]
MQTLEKLKTGQLRGVKELKLACDLTQVPPEIFDLAESLELLILSNNQLTSLPDEFAQLKRLKIVFFNNNRFTEFPQVLARCPQLSMVSFKGNNIAHIDEAALSPHFRWLILTDNQLTQLPRSIGKLNRLQKLMLAGNQLQSLPAEMVNCQNLELTRLSANQLPSLPDWLMSLPKLSWLAYAGNPFCRQTHPTATVPTIPTAHLELQATLGEGASGVIYKSLWHNSTAGEASTTVAVKLFKGAITSDGRPEDEMLACMAAGRHSNLVNVQGKLSQPLDNKQGLVFSFIPENYRNLGGPPSLDSCTRDTYPEGTTFTLATALEIARGTASATQHLHDRGIMHGDLYAHNTLINETGHSILGDFGAASFYDRPKVGPALEHLEVRAFGCLLDDLLNHIDSVTPPSSPQLTALQGLKQACLHPHPLQRPQFETIYRTLATLVDD